MPTPGLPLPGATLPSALPVLPDLSADAPQPTPAGVAGALGRLIADPALGATVSAEVVDIASGTVLFAASPAVPAAPASTTKILTAAAALSALGPLTTLPTRAVLGSRPGEIVLVGGGDVMLAPGAGDRTAVEGHAGLGDLARETATALRARGVTSVTLGLDDTLFSGPSISPSWAPGDVDGGFVAPVMPLEVTVGVTTPGISPAPGSSAARVADPALSAARGFARQLAADGITVTGSVARDTAPPDPTVLGEVRSADIADIVEHDLTDSDNTAAEALARLVAVATGEQATFAGGAAAVLDRIARLGIPVSGASLSGGSGLGSGYEIPAQTVVRTLTLAASAAHPELRALLTGLPVAGASGTLSDRFTASSMTGGVGVVRAKTGTLTGVGALAGTVVDADGRLLAFAVIADHVGSIGAGRSALDALATALADCGCR